MKKQKSVKTSPSNEHIPSPQTSTVPSPLPISTPLPPPITPSPPPALSPQPIIIPTSPELPQSIGNIIVRCHVMYNVYNIRCMFGSCQR